MAESAGEEASEQLTAGPATAAGIGVTGSGPAETQLVPSFEDSLALGTGDSAAASPGLLASAAAAPGLGVMSGVGSVVSGTAGDVPQAPPSFGTAIGILGTAVGTAILAPSSGIGLGLTGSNAPNTAGGLHPIAGAVAGAGVLPQLHATFWDPTISTDWDSEKASQQCILRIKRDIMSIYKEPPPGMFVVPDPHDMTKIHALITGPFDTPYEGGFFLFLFRCPPDYPIHPPRVKLMTTGNSTVRFNPNFYRNGKVCLSILGTWTGPAWSPAQSISSVLISIQSLMTENPYHNEPGFEQDPFGEKRGHFDYQNLLSRLRAIQQRLKEKCQSQEKDVDTDSDSSSTGTDPDSQGSSKP
ncbi:ubiquitin-conjugating enzyme E2 Z isoform X2 [Polyodon spathula]|uniref:ubiquitin-conjugating enzyme E2 Z isoform X2 n=1 Tax=Polyodon spathula TaxID=7913 RepID=UPI001B7F68E3|nr:ubiquitin-conjugating enzyme E2 Z isoform X2 [Polyodon spathula]